MEVATKCVEEVEEEQTNAEVVVEESTHNNIIIDPPLLFLVPQSNPTIKVHLSRRRIAEKGPEGTNRGNYSTV